MEGFYHDVNSVLSKHVTVEERSSAQVYNVFDSAGIITCMSQSVVVSGPSYDRLNRRKENRALNKRTKTDKIVRKDGILTKLPG